MELSLDPAILLAISNSVRFGIMKIILSSLGNISGLFISSSAVIFDLGAVLKWEVLLF